MNNSLKRRIMARIYFEYTKNTFREYPDYFMFALFVAVVFTFVSLHDVLNNLPKDNFPGAFNFLVVAVRDTSWFIQIMIAGFLIRVAITGYKLIHKNVKNINLNWVTSKLRY